MQILVQIECMRKLDGAKWSIQQSCQGYLYSIAMWYILHAYLECAKCNSRKRLGHAPVSTAQNVGRGVEPVELVVEAKQILQ